MADVVTLDLEARAVLGAGRQDVLDVAERVAEDAVARAFEIGFFPFVLEGLEPFEHGIEPEIHRAHVERRDLRRKCRGRLDALLDRHGRGAAGGDVDHAVRALLDHLQERRERLQRLVGPPVFRVASVEMDDGGTGLGRLDRGLRDLVRRHRQMRRHRRRVDRARHGAADDDLVVVCHVAASPILVRPSTHSRRGYPRRLKPSACPAQRDSRNVSRSCGLRRIWLVLRRAFCIPRRVTTRA